MLNEETLIEDMLREAQSWVGTRYEHQGKIKGKVVDCVHFVDHVLIKTVGEPLGLDFQIPYNYNPKEDGRVLLEYLKTILLFVPAQQRMRGDIVAFIDPDLRDPDRPSHLAFIDLVTPITTYIIEAGRAGVVRHRLDGLWLKRIHSVWRIDIPKIQAYQQEKLTLAAA